MAVIRNSNPASGAPGIEPRWTRGAKDGVGTAYSVASSVWYTLSAGVVSEVYYPTIDRPQVRDLQFLITDGATFFHDERRHLDTRIFRPEPYALGYQVVNTDREGRYRLVKEIIADPGADRYRNPRPQPPDIWKFNRQVRSVRPGVTLRIQAEASFMLHWTLDEWRHEVDTNSTSTALGIDFMDIKIPLGQTAPVRFTFFWTTDERWEGRDFCVEISAPGASAASRR